MEAIDNFAHRRSIRKYKPRQIADTELQAVLKAGTFAPSGRNLQSSIIVAVQNPQDIALMSRLNAQIMGTDSDPFYGAPTVLVVLSRRDGRFPVEDGSLVMGNLLNAACAVGLGSCWVNRARELFDMPEGKALLQKWGIEGEYIGIGNCILGYPDEAPAAKPRKDDYVYIIK